MSAEQPPQEARPLIPLEPVGDDKEYREGLEKQGIIVAEDVLCPYCGLEAPKEGIHEICIMKELVATNKKVIESNQSLDATIGRLIANLDDAARRQPLVVPQINLKDLVGQIMAEFEVNDNTRILEVDKPLTLMQRRAQQKIARRGRR